jgi:hypothetical protein
MNRHQTRLIDVLIAPVVPIKSPLSPTCPTRGLAVRFELTLWDNTFGWLCDTLYPIEIFGGVVLAWYTNLDFERS